MSSTNGALQPDLQLNQKQIDVYSALASSGKATAALLARETQLPRSTVYSILETLIPMGLVSVDNSAAVRQFIANAPEALTRYVRQKKEEVLAGFEAQEKIAIETAKALAGRYRQRTFNVPRIQFFESKQNVSSMLHEQSPVWQESIRQYDMVWWGYQDHTFVENYRDWLDAYWSNMYEGEEIRLLSNSSQTEKVLRGQVKRRTIIEVPKKFSFSSTIWVLGDYIISISTHHQPHYAFQIHDTIFAANMRKMFQMYWELHSSAHVFPDLKQ